MRWLSHFAGQIDSATDPSDHNDLAVDFISLTTPHCLIAGTSQEITAPYVEVQLTSGSRGACFLHRGDLAPVDLEGIAGQSAFGLLARPVHPFIRVALVDALFSLMPKPVGVSTECFCFSGSYAKKSRARGDIIASAAEIESGHRVGIVGVVYDIVRACLQRGAEVFLADIGQSGTEMLGIPIVTNGADLIKRCDVSIVTGNVLKTDTLGDVLAAAVSKPLCIYAMTGHNIAPHYLRHGADVVITESFPYYWHSGSTSSLNIHRLDGRANN